MKADNTRSEIQNYFYSFRRKIFLQKLFHAVNSLVGVSCKMQSNVAEKFSNKAPHPVVVKPEGKVEAFDSSQYQGKYLVLVVIRAAWDPQSTAELINYSVLLKDFQKSGCDILGISRDGPAVLIDFLQENKEVHVPIVSDLSLDKNDIGLSQRLGIRLFNGYPVPSLVAIDSNGLIRYVSSQQPAGGNSGAELLRIVKALKAVENASGGILCPADWEPSIPTIVNSEAGVNVYYKQNFNAKSESQELEVNDVKQEPESESEPKEEEDASVTKDKEEPQIEVTSEQ